MVRTLNKPPEGVDPKKKKASTVVEYKSCYGEIRAFIWLGPRTRQG